MGSQVLVQAPSTPKQPRWAWPHLWEFMDLDRLPLGLRNTMREVLECGNGKPFRSYYCDAVASITKHASALGVERIVEMGAGTAPLTRRLCRSAACSQHLAICDANPDREAYRELERCFPERVSANYAPVDFSKPRHWPERSLLVLSATLHHLPTEARSQAMAAMVRSADAVLIIEPLRRTLSSLLFVILSAIPALLLPLLFIGRTGTLRRLLWCWIFPIAPLVFVWDGWISCLRQWSDQQYRDWAQEHDVEAEVSHSLFSQVVLLRRR